MKKKNLFKVKKSKRRISTKEKDENSEHEKNSKDQKSDNDSKSESFDEKQLNNDKTKNTTQNLESANRDNFTRRDSQGNIIGRESYDNMSIKDLGKTSFLDRPLTTKVIREIN